MSLSWLFLPCLHQNQHFKSILQLSVVSKIVTITMIEKITGAYKVNLLN